MRSSELSAHKTLTYTADFAADVRRDLSLAPKQLQSKYLYDALGSSLFEAICRLPWYGITRAETRLLETYAPEIVSRVCLPRGTGQLDRTTPTIVELGCGSGEKLVILAEALQTAGASARVHLIDISSQALEQSERTLSRMRQRSSRACVCRAGRTRSIARRRRSSNSDAAAAKSS